MIELTRYGHNSYKKTGSVSTALIFPEALSKREGLTEDGVLKVDDKILLMKLPENAVITDAYIVVINAPTENTAQLKVEAVKGEDTHELIASTELGSESNKVIGSLDAKIYTDTGMSIVATIGTADVKSGQFQVVINYTELDKANGSLTNL